MYQAEEILSDHFGPFFLNGSIFQSFAGITNIARLSSEINGIAIIGGVEIDIVNPQGDLAFFDSYFSFDQETSIGEKLCKKSQVVIASYHDFYQKLSVEENTKVLLNVIGNPYVHILGHIDRIEGDIDFELLLPKVKEKNKIVEINCSTFYQNGDIDSLKILVEACLKHEVSISIGSDAHVAYEIGQFNELVSFLKEIDFPEDKIISTNLKKFRKAINKVK